MARRSKDVLGSGDIGLNDPEVRGYFLVSASA